MPKPVELKGRPASPGIATGTLFRFDRQVEFAAHPKNGGDERARLATAVAAAIEQITGLMAATDGVAAAILEFQAAMLSDDDLAAPALAEIVKGAPAEAAWLAALQEQIDEYESADDEYLRARAADITDLRDRVLRNLAGADAAASPPGAILVGGDLTPTRFLETDWSAGGGIALFGGSATSHVAMLARSRGVPMVVGLGIGGLDSHAEAIVDGAAGTVTLSPGASEHAAFAQRRQALVRARSLAERFSRHDARTTDGTRIQIMVNVAGPDEVDDIDIATCDGVGLMRTEFLFAEGRLPDEEQQYRAYAKVLDWAAGKPVTIRTIDAGGDKPVAGLTVDEQNPFLGLRGIRLSLVRPDVFRVQLRALARAAMHGNLKVMLPMVTVPEEISAARRELDNICAELDGEGASARRPSLGIMIEVPATAIMPERYTEADFFSIGSNDLTQYVTAAARDSSHVAGLCDVTNPAVSQLIANVAAFGARAGIDVSLCGDAAGAPELVPGLLKAGLRSLSLAPTALGDIKAAIAEVRLDG
jgi:phosphoenolpyruvate-protein phosphotransferase (PTS system enzyme I)